MSTTIQLPKLGFTMSEGVIVEWYVADGGMVRAGELLYALEAEKATQEIEAPASGTLRIMAQPGETHPVGAVLGYIE